MLGRITIMVGVHGPLEESNALRRVLGAWFEHSTARESLEEALDEAGMTLPVISFTLHDPW